jgi:cobalt-zinc-cadmium efflux system protein
VKAPERAEHDHDHEHGHDHQHEHHDHDREAPIRARGSSGFNEHEARQARRLGTVICMVGGFFVLELAGAIWAGSVVLQADALHLLTDVLTLGANLLAMRIAVREPTPRFTYGLRRAEPIAALMGAVLVLGTTALLVAEGVHAFRERTPPRAGLMLVFALMALCVKGCSAWLLHDAIGGHSHGAGPGAPPKKHGHVLNLRSAWLHMVGDALGAIAALVAALVIRFGGSPTADPVASFLVAAILVVGSLRIVFDAGLVLLEAAPDHLPVATIRAMVAGLPEVDSVRDLHVWTLGGGHDAITLCVTTRSSDPTLGAKLSETLKGSLGVEYVTVQVESAGPQD